MPASKYISSIQNPEVRQLEHWNRKSRDRRKSGLFVLEGLRELGLALRGGYTPEKIYFCEEILPESELEQSEALKGIERVRLSPDVYRHLAFRGKTEGVIALMKSRDHSLEQLKLQRKNPLILIAESPEKPGNIGALLRTADAAGLDAVIIADIKGDLYNPNVIRSSVGCLFTVPVAVASTAEVIEWLQTREVQLIVTSLEGALRYDLADYGAATAIAVGTEATGLTQPWLAAADAAVKIPMSGHIDSMNVSVAAAVTVFEACRQRGFGNKGE